MASPQLPKKIIKKLSEEEKKIRLEIIERVVTFISAGLTFVAALAWNDAIQSFFKTFLNSGGSSLWAKFGYAFLVTLIFVFVSFQLSRLLHLTKKRLGKQK